MTLCPSRKTDTFRFLYNSLTVVDNLCFLTFYGDIKEVSLFVILRY